MNKTDVVEIKTGNVQGFIEKGIRVFKGIPYAESPINELRFKAPSPKKKWTGIFEAFSFGPDAPQNPSPFTPQPAPSQNEKKCLTLNVWTPALDDKKRPVMFWIHGGSFKTGGATRYDGNPLSSLGDTVIVVINYRLGSFGFFHDPDASDYSPNVGLLDQIEALRWVKDNIIHFGGDPNNVTIFGESAGAAAIATLIGMPSAQGLFNKLITQSGSCSRGGYQELRVISTIRKLMSIIGIEKGDIDGLRKVPFEDIIKGQVKLDIEAAKEGIPFLYGYSPIIDGEYLPQHPLDAVLNGEIKDKQLLAGTNLDEMALWDLWNPIPKTDEELFTRINRTMKLRGRTEEQTIQVIDTYKKSRSEPRKIASAITTDSIFRIPTIKLVEAQNKFQKDTYMYLFTYPSPVQNGNLGSIHAIEIPFVFGTLSIPRTEFFPKSNEETEKISLQMQKSWLSFARNGKPNNDSIPNWPAYEKERATMVFGKESKLINDPYSEEREIWDKIL